MKTNYKKHILLFFIFFSAAMILSAAAVVTVDPFFQYHKPLKGLCYIIDNQTSQNPGIAKTFDYDSVILGSSMTVNFDTSLFEETMGLHTVKLCYNGAYPKDIDEIMKLVSLYHPDLKEVFLGIDINTYKTPADVTAYELPYYLYDDLLLNDVSYWLNKDVLLDYILKPQMKHENTPLNEIYWSWIHFSYNREAALASYQVPDTFHEPLPSDIYLEDIEDHMRDHILPYIESMPDTRFTIFFPPYSILYWHSRRADGSLAAELAGERKIMELLFSCPNVRIFYFQNDFDYITDLNHYCDYSHYSPEMNAQMTRWFAADDCPYEVTPENYEAVMDETEQWMEAFDFEHYF